MCVCVPDTYFFSVILETARLRAASTTDHTALTTTTTVASVPVSEEPTPAQAQAHQAQAQALQESREQARLERVRGMYCSSCQKPLGAMNMMHSTAYFLDVVSRVFIFIFVYCGNNSHSSHCV